MLGKMSHATKNIDRGLRFANWMRKQMAQQGISSNAEAGRRLAEALGLRGDGAADSGRRQVLRHLSGQFPNTRMRMAYATVFGEEFPEDDDEEEDSLDAALAKLVEGVAILQRVRAADRRDAA